MRPRERGEVSEQELFRSRLAQIIDMKHVATVAFEGIEARAVDVQVQVAPRPSFVNDKAWFPEGNFRCASIVAAPLLVASLWRLYAVKHL
jgi:hypothetical protein